MIKAIFTDMDDTLIENQSLYEEAKKKLCDFLAPYGVTAKEALDFYEPKDKELFKTYGYSRQRFPATFEQTLRHFIPNADEETVKTVRGFAEEVYDTTAPLKPGVKESLKKLMQKYPVYLVTAGDQSVQKARVEKLSFKKDFAGIFVIGQKDKDVFTDVTQAVGVAPDEVIMIGDSLRSDIVPAVAAGLHAVWIEADNWSHEDVSRIPKKNVDEARSFSEAVQRILKGDIPSAASKPVPNKPAAPKAP